MDVTFSSIDLSKGIGDTWQLWSNNYVTILDKLIICNIILTLLYSAWWYSTLQCDVIFIILNVSHRLQCDIYCNEIHVFI